MEKRILLGHEGAANERKYGPSLNKYSVILSVLDPRKCEYLKD